MRTMAVVFVSLVVSVFCPPLVLAQEKNSPPIREIITIENISEYSLANGMKALLYPDPSTSKVTVNATVFVGSRHEGYGEAGMAHLLEHMVFKGTRLHPDIPKVFKDRGAMINGTTWLDRTNYFEILPAEGDNLEFAIRLEADRLFNSLIRREDLASEMTVVRNEFERGENDPERVLSQRMMSAAFEWHNYGKSTIGNRADIERVPIEKLQAFYKKYYRVDNLMLILAGNFKRDQALQLIVKYFGDIKPPATPLENTYTEEPAQDGPRQVGLRRVGKAGAVGVLYHIPSGSHPDFPALEILGDILASQPSGPLYKALVEGKLASSVSAGAYGWHDPGVLEVMASVESIVSPEKARDVLLQSMEQVRSSPILAADVERAKLRFTRARGNQMADSNRIGIALSDWAAKGDWRLFFYHRDQMAKVTPGQVEQVAKKYLVSNNSTVGVYYPTTAAERTPVPPSPDLASLLKDYKGGQALAQGEFFDPAIDNCIQRNVIGEVGPGIRYSFLPKKTRNEMVALQIAWRYGNEQSLAGKNSAAALLPSLMTRGTKEKNRQQIEDAQTRLQAMVRGQGSAGEMRFSVMCKRDAVGPVLDLLHEMVRAPSFPLEEFETLKRQTKDMVERGLTDPGTLASRMLFRKLHPYPASDVRYIPTAEEHLKRVESATLEDVKSLYADQAGLGEVEIISVGDFEPAVVLAKMEKTFGGWKAKASYQRIARPASFPSKGEKLVIETPDKENAVFLAGLSFPVMDNNPDFAALQLADFILGSGSLSSRLGNRVRQKEGLAYGVRSGLSASSLDPAAVFQISVSCNPKKVREVDVAVFDEIGQFLEKGLSEKEFQESQKALLAQMKVERSSDLRLAALMGENLSAGRNMAFYKNLEKEIQDLTKEKVVASFKKQIDPKKLIVIWAGDFSKK
ncbi:MAG: insulinase family protein [Gemmataceae bacterium]|nr:insulinase family protein [Gemmataceae bacterium]